MMRTVEDAAALAKIALDLAGALARTERAPHVHSTLCASRSSPSKGCPRSRTRRRPRDAHRRSFIGPRRRCRGRHVEGGVEGRGQAGRGRPRRPGARTPGMGGAGDRCASSRGADDLVIAETAHGFVCAHAGVDGSNVPPDRIALLPLDPDGSAERLRDRAEGARRRRGRGRAERHVRPPMARRTDERGDRRRRPRTDARPSRREGRVRNVARGDGHRGRRRGRCRRRARDGQERRGPRRPSFAASRPDGSAPAAHERSCGHPTRICSAPVRSKRSRPADRSATFAKRGRFRRRRSNGPSPQPRRPRRRTDPAPLSRGGTSGSAARHRAAGFLDAMEEAWRRDLADDRLPSEKIDRSDRRARARSSAERRCCSRASSRSPAADRYTDARRLLAEREMFLTAAGASVQNLMLALNAQGVGSCWLSTSIFCSEESAQALGHRRRLAGGRLRDRRLPGRGTADTRADRPEPFPRRPLAVRYAINPRMK